MSIIEEKKNYKEMFSTNITSSAMNGTVTSTTLDGGSVGRRTRESRVTTTTTTGTGQVKSSLSQNYMRIDEILSNTNLS